MPFDIAIIAIVLALILLVVFFSAVVLYLSFRLKETFRKETRRGATIAKTAFLIGILFLAGGIFYFFANTLANINQPAPTASPTPTGSPSPTPTLSPSPSPMLSPSPSPTATPTPSPHPALSLSISYPPTAKMSSQITMSFTIVNPTGSAVHAAAIQTNVLFQIFAVQSSTYPVVGNVINIGDVPPGTTIVSLELLAPNRPREVNDTITLVYQEMINPITQEITISVRGN
jgi:hypothetical protein